AAASPVRFFRPSRPAPEEIPLRSGREGSHYAPLPILVQWNISTSRRRRRGRPNKASKNLQMSLLFSSAEMRPLRYFRFESGNAAGKEIHSPRYSQLLVQVSRTRIA